MFFALLVKLVIYAARKNMITVRRSREKKKLKFKCFKNIFLYLYFFNVCLISQDHFCCYKYSLTYLLTFL